MQELGICKVKQPSQAVNADSLRGDPPLLIGGSIQTKSSTYGGDSQPISRGIDWLTVTVGPVATDWLLAKTVEGEDGGSMQGFAKTQVRGIGFKPGREASMHTVRRRFEPFSPSSRWGINYESWQASSYTSHIFAELLSSGPVTDMRTSRVDVVWDCAVTEDDNADTFVDSVRSIVNENGIKIFDAGEESNHTKYIGARTSERMIRIYRKDRESPEFFPSPTLRIELELKGDTAHAWWPVFCEDAEAGYGAAAAHIKAMTGHEVQRPGVIPPKVINPQPDLAQTLFHCLDQYGTALNAANRAGVDVMGLARLKSEVAGRSSQTKANRGYDQLKTYGVREVEELISGRLA